MFDIALRARCRRPEPGYLRAVTGARTEGPADDSVAWLLGASHQLAPAELVGAVARALEGLGVRSSRLFLVDHDQMALHPLGPRPEASTSFAIDGTIGGRAFALERTFTVPTDEGVRIWLPLIDGTARLGVMCVDLDATAAADEATRQRLELVASLVAELLVSKAHYTDAFELVRRREAMSLEAELQRGNLPPVSLITSQVTVAGLLLPAYEVAGDSFDYALNAEALDVAVIDSVGHELESSLISHLVQGSLRNSRRNGLGLADAYTAADAAVRRIFPDLRFATAAFGRLGLDSGRFRWICAGHPRPLLVRRSKVVGEVQAVTTLPVGLGGTEPVVNEIVLEAGDALLLYTDGVVEGGARRSEPFGLDRLTDLLGRNLLSDLPPAEMLRRLVAAVFEHSAYELRDDTTLLLVELGTEPDH
jgi:serine phosphatase RsbU (regulator of sigma subunit)